MSKVLLLLAVLLPRPLKLFTYRKILGWTIGQNVRIGFSYIDADKVDIGDNVYIGNLNVIRCVKQLQIGKNSRIVNFNQFFGRRDNPRWPSQLTIGEKVQFMSHHFIDAGGTVTIGDRTTVGGRDTQIWSHSLIYQTGEGVMGPISVSIGEDVYIGARSTLVGCQIPNKAVIGAGSVITKDFSHETGRILIAGNPGVIKKRYEIKAVSTSSIA
ncbi:MAG: hypothetical protein IGS48_05760 [Oscillatoriales cyanobacterium C42_A2020_001]|nr:hypothetical protein [Leptolyngbyaceae cyanobacterium C42_A2020_001]